MDEATTLATAERLEATMADLCVQFQVANTRIQRNKKMIRVLAGLIALQGIIVACLVLLFWRTDRNEDAARTAQLSAEVTSKVTAERCALGNEARAAQRELWAYILEASSGPNAAPPQQIDKFRAYVNKNFRALNCAEILRPVTSAGG